MSNSQELEKNKTFSEIRLLKKLLMNVLPKRIIW